MTLSEKIISFVIANRRAIDQLESGQVTTVVKHFGVLKHTILVEIAQGTTVPECISTSSFPPAEQKNSS